MHFLATFALDGKGSKRSGQTLCADNILLQDARQTHKRLFCPHHFTWLNRYKEEQRQMGVRYQIKWRWGHINKYAHTPRQTYTPTYTVPTHLHPHTHTAQHTTHNTQHTTHSHVFSSLTFFEVVFGKRRASSAATRRRLNGYIVTSSSGSSVCRGSNMCFAHSNSWERSQNSSETHFQKCNPVHLRPNVSLVCDTKYTFRVERSLSSVNRDCWTPWNTVCCLSSSLRADHSTRACFAT